MTPRRTLPHGRRVFALPCAVALLCAATIGEAGATVALAYGQVPGSSIAYGIARGDDARAAGAHAMAICRGGAKSESVAQRCKIVATKASSCFAVAIGDVAGGWGTAASAEAAQSQALAMCRKTSSVCQLVQASLRCAQ